MTRFRVLSGLRASHVHLFLFARVLPLTTTGCDVYPVWCAARTQEGHELTVNDIGEEISVGSSQMILLNITENEVEISEPFVGEDVLEG